MGLDMLSRGNKAKLKWCMVLVSVYMPEDR